jgi:hypothetical protein
MLLRAADACDESTYTIHPDLRPVT